MSSGSRRRRARLALLVCLALGASFVLVSSCGRTAPKTLVAPPAIPGATFVGSAACDECHADIVKTFSDATHALLVAQGDHAVAIGCESCHGPGSEHVESGGARATIVNPGRSAEACFTCHLDKRGEFALPHTHPVTSGPLGLAKPKVSCTDCHEPHAGDAVVRNVTNSLSESKTCLQCHVAQRGPFVFEHEAVRDGCTTCHAPHGSVNAKMLTERDSTLCLKCHFQEQTSPGTILIGGRDHSGFLARGTCFNTGCHEAVHGSNVNSSLRF